MSKNIEKKIIGIAIIMMIVILLGLCVVITADVHHAGSGSYPTSIRQFLAARRARGPLSPTDTELLRPWMTFDYVNQLFGLPQDYLKLALNINDSRYPNLSFSEYSESLSTSSEAFLGLVRSAISESTTTPR
jgi:hypothetical protein